MSPIHISFSDNSSPTAVRPSCVSSAINNSMAFLPLLPITSFTPAKRVSLSRSSTRSCSPFRRALLRMQQSPDDELSVPLSSLNDKLQKSEKPVEQSLQSPIPPEQDNDTRSEAQKEIDRLRAAEKFIEIDEGKYECLGCGYIYEPVQGDKQNSIPPGTPFQDLPPSYVCPVCRTPKSRFMSKKKIIAGFADNQQYGFGSNTLTSGQKNLLIFGGLAICVLLLLSGYALN